MKMEKGQSLVEMALGFIILLTIVGGLIDIGRWYFIRAAMEDAVGDSASYFGAFPGCVDEDSGWDCGDPLNAVARAKGDNVENVSLINFETATVTLSCYTLEDKEPLDCVTEATTGDVVKVDMYHDFDLLGSVIPEIAGMTTIKLHSTATQIITGR